MMNNFKTALIVRSLRILTESRPLLCLPSQTLHIYLPAKKDSIYPLKQTIFQFRNFCDSVAASAGNTSDVASTGEEQKEELPLHRKAVINPARDRRIKIPVETSIRYLQSAAFKECYGNDPVWKPYRRNHKGQRPRKVTRKTCIRKNAIVTGSPCPICRDEYLVVDYKNVELLKHFISPITGDYISFDKTHVCQRQHKKILIALLKAKDFGLIPFDVRFRKYDYSEYMVE